jgi:hypothetical protein
MLVRMEHASNHQWEIAAALSEEDIKELFRLARKSPWKNLILLIAYVPSLVIIGFFVLMLATGHAHELGDNFLLACLLAVAAFLWTHWRAYSKRRTMSAALKKQMLEWIYVEEKGIRTRSKASAETFDPWENFSELCAGRRIALLRCRNHSGGLPIPLSSLTSETRTELITALSARIPVQER